MAGPMVSNLIVSPTSNIQLHGICKTLFGHNMLLEYIWLCRTGLLEGPAENSSLVQAVFDQEFILYYSKY